LFNVGLKFVCITQFPFLFCYISLGGFFRRFLCIYIGNVYGFLWFTITEEKNRFGAHDAALFFNCTREVGLRSLFFNQASWKGNSSRVYSCNNLSAVY
jgi:hypothetical protein